ncbi:hypothetical protein HIM_06549 [Hirsutella minnesotensis 3608]|uniref:PXA domain-containing protein n=1 Tax=Hirsutella minnesotensis 3608 TaxID=1043627 RepID=A0A0F7ZNP3_9HYPO|nr:hypothetical protein HIM_06549 [Hirsutella minnesotensis 3608]
MTASASLISPAAVPPRAATPRLKPSTSSAASASHVAANRRTPRPAALDPLSDAATQALIRRTLCPQQAHDKARDEQPPPIEQLLPPLTSRNDVDLELYAFLAIILREFVQSWYGNITTDESFVAEILHIVAHVSRALEQRLRGLDLESLVLDELPELLGQHIAAYRTAHQGAMRAPVVVEPHDVYHSLWPLPHLSPVPRRGDEASQIEQSENEAAYRQLLVQGVLAILLPTEDLENPCLTALVGQIFSELIIGGVLVNKASQPWLLFEGICILARVVEGKTPPKDAKLSNPDSKVPRNSSARILHRLMLYMFQIVLSLFSWMRLLLETVAISHALPPRASYASVAGTERSDQGPDLAMHAQVPVLESSIWRCAGDLIELNSRMPWLAGILSLMQFGAVHGPGRIARWDGTFDRLLSHRISGLFSPARLSATLRTLRGVLFPNNAPGTSSLTPPSSETELHDLRRRAAKAVWDVLPKSIGRVYFGTSDMLGLRARADECVGDEGAIDDVERILMVLGDEYCNKHLVYGMLELLLVRLMPELSEKGIVELWEERLG